MSTTPPGIEFYDRVFTKSSKDQQASFLRTLFTKDACLRSSYQSYINPQYFSIEELKADIEKRCKDLQSKIKKYDWRSCYDVDPVANDYYDIITEILEKKFLSNLILRVTSSCRIGVLTTGIAHMRVIEKALDLDWEKLPEPASITEDLSGYFFYLSQDLFLAEINDYVYAPVMINNSLQLISAIMDEGSSDSSNVEVWNTVASMLRIQLVQF